MASPMSSAGVQAGDDSASDTAAIAGLPEPEQKPIADEAKRSNTTLKTAKTGNGTAFNSDEPGGTITIAVRPSKPKNGTSVVSGKDKAADAQGHVIVMLVGCGS